MGGLDAIDYRHGAIALRGELALPSGAGRHPGVVVFHGGLGLTEDVRAHARRLAASGYAAMVADMYGSCGEMLDPQVAGEQMIALQAEPMQLRERAGAAVDALIAHPAVDDGRVAAIGFCFGGQCALELARAGAALEAAVCFHGVLTTHDPAKPGKVKGQVAVFTGARDPLAPAEHVAQLREELTGAGARWQITVYGEGWHGFMDEVERPRYDWIRYDPALHAQAWAATLALLDTALSPSRHIAHDATAPAAIH